MPNILLKSTFRRPVHVLSLFLLISSISFVFISRTAEYLIVQHETERLGGYFRSVGSIVPLNSENDGEDISEAVSLIEQSSFVEFGDKRRYASGVLDGIFNSDVDGGMADITSFWTGTPISWGFDNSDVLFYGELTEKSEEPVYRYYPNDILAGYPMYFRVDTVVAGYPEYIRRNMNVRVVVSPDLDVIDQMEIGQRYFIRAWFEPNSIALRGWRMASQNLQMKPLMDEGPNFLLVPIGEFLDFSSPDLETLQQEIEIVQENQSSMLVTTTVDMSALPLVQESAHWYYLTEGRWINREDTLSANKVCVVRAEFAEMRGFMLGDTITLTLRSLHDDVYQAYIDRNSPDRENWKNFPTAELMCEIVGLYSQLEHRMTVEFNTIYIPNSIFIDTSQGSDNTLQSYDYSFVLKSPRDEEAFLQENQQVLANLGLEVVFVENNSEEFWKAVNPLRLSALTSVLIFGSVLVLTSLLAVFLYFRQLRGDFAILRALGVPKGIATQQLLHPVSLIGSLGIITGGGVSWHYSMNIAAETLSALPTPAGAMPSATLDLLWLIGLCTGSLGLLLGFILLGAVFIARQPVLVLLQGKSVGFRKRGKKERRVTPDLSEQLEPPIDKNKKKQLGNLSSEAILTTPEIHERKKNFWGLIRYQSRHLLRSGFKSLLIILVALGFVLALGWMQWTIEHNTVEVNGLYNSIVVDAQIVKRNASTITISDYGFINRRIVEAILETGFVKNAYLEATSEQTNVGKMDEETFEIIPYEQIDGLSLIAFDQPDIFFHPQDYSVNHGAVIGLEYSPGWDESLFTETWTEEMLEMSSVPAVFPMALLQLLELEYEDIIYITNKGITTRLRVVGKYIGGEGFSNDTVLMPLSALDVIDGSYLGYSVAEFELDPLKNREMPTFRGEVEALIDESISGQIPLRVVIWDEELRSVVEPLEKNLSLMTILYPVTIALSVLIAIGLNFLLVIQNAKDAAILRVLGTEKSKVRALFSGEQILLSLIGLVVGLVALGILRREVAMVFSNPSLVSAGLFMAGAVLGSFMGAILVTRRKPLELLQVKE